MPSDGGRWRLSDDSAQVLSPWVWRGFLFMALVAAGLCLNFWASGRTALAVAWTVITAGWLAVAMWLWRRHHAATQSPGVRAAATAATTRSVGGPGSRGRPPASTT
jgi:hypothetical protein